MSRNTVIFGTALFVLAAVLVFWLNRGPPTLDSSSLDTAPAIHVDDAVPEINAPVSEGQLDAQDSWEREHGYVSNEREYLRKLSERDIADLIEQGNTRAMTTLAARNLSNDPETMMGLYRLAAVHGNTTGLVSAALAWTTPHVYENATT